ncbi:hypothetical protein [Mesorhizobium sp. CN2-181]|uniref:hypothetical protein n=1 Tax=Mesorhizobium yinganensis TaxID=3157707 RepID=UPI0032B8114D
MPRTYVRKADDATIVKLNNVGLSLQGIADRQGVHLTTITNRLRVLGIAPADTRRAFMEDVFESLTAQQQDWLIDQLAPGHSVKEFIRALLIKEFMSRQRPGKAP